MPKEKKVKKTSAKAKTVTKVKPVKVAKVVDPTVILAKRGRPAKVKAEKIKKNAISATILNGESATEIKTKDINSETTLKSPKIKIKKVRASASVGTINLRGKEAELLKKYQHGKNDTGSTEVQVALFSAKINSLSKHLRKHTKDSDSKRGLLIMVGKRRRLLNYLIKNDLKRYESLIADLGLRK